MGDAVPGGGAIPGTIKHILSHTLFKIFRYSLGAICGREPSLKTRDIKTPTPSKTPSRMPHATAEPNADRGPPINRGFKN